MPAAAKPVEVVALSLGTVAVEVDADFVPRTAARTRALLREGRECLSLDAVRPDCIQCIRGDAQAGDCSVATREATP